MMTLYNMAGKPVTLDNEVARGGEGVIYTVRGRADLVAKVYVPMPGEGREGKLRWMLAHPPDNPGSPAGHAAIAWPNDLLFDGQRRFLGYLMPYIQGTVPVLQVFNPRSRAATLPGFDRRYLYRAAHNLARALGALHKSDYYVGDLNESNILVTPSALVTIIDTDSFQVQEPTEETIIIYPCRVGKPEYTARELQGQALRKVVRKWEHDAFALGVLIFQLLLDGNHPFRARWLGTGDPPPIEERIRRGLFPYPINDDQRPGSKANQNDPAIASLIAPPPNVLGLATLDPALANLMRRCFLEGHDQPSRRPTALEWEQTLAEAERNLVDCERGHIYAGHLAACPVCGSARATSPVSQTPKQAPRGTTTRQSSGRGPRPGPSPRPAAGAASSAQPTGSAGQSAGTPKGTPSGASVDWFRLLLESLTMILANTVPSSGAPGGPAGSAGSQKTTRSTWQQQAQRWAWNAWVNRQAHARGGQQTTVGQPRPVGATAAPAAGPATLRCGRCGATNQPNEVFCQKCGFPLGATRPCPQCGKPMPEKTRFCTHCDTRI
jgi:serine/threonine protein kinase